MDFVAVDFETASASRSSACAVGAAVVRKGHVEKSLSELIRPPVIEFDDRCVAIHGINAEQVKDAPTFPQIWPQLQDTIGDLPVAMHNASFDISVLTSTLYSYRIPLPDLRFFCTLELSRRYLPGLPNHRLGTLATVFGIPLDHHEPSSDATACARLGVLLTRLADASGVENDYLCDLATYEAQRTDDSIHLGPCVSISLQDIEAAGYCVEAYGPFLTDAAPSDGRFEGMRFVFTGELTFLTREEARSIVELQGGKATTSVSRKSDCLVVGSDALAAKRRGAKVTGKLAKALELQAAGASLRIIDEAEFVEMIR